MARPRKKKETAWQRRNREAQAKGYRNYYDYRIHDYGKRPPAEPVQKGKRARKSGAHTAAAFKRALKTPDRLSLIVEAPRKRGPGGEWQQIAFVAITSKGEIREYYIDVDDQDDLDYWHDLIDDAGVDFLEYGSVAAAVAA